MEPNIWTKDCGNYYEYIRVYVDILLIASKDSKIIVKSLEDVHKFKLKGTGAIRYHLSYNFFRCTKEYFVLHLRNILKR